MCECHKQGCEFYDQRMTDNCSKGDPPDVANCQIRLNSRRGLKEQVSALTACVAGLQEAKVVLLEQLSSTESRVKTLQVKLEAAYRREDAFVEAQRRLLEQRDEARANVDRVRQMLKNCLSEGAAQSAACATTEVEGEVRRLRSDLDEADRLAGVLLREKTTLETHVAAERDWLLEAKNEAGYDENVSFDVVWREVLAKSRRFDQAVAGGFLTDSPTEKPEESEPK